MISLALLITGLVPGNGQTMALHDGDRVVFYGDSITAQRMYTRFVDSFVNAGVPGDTVNGGYTGDRATRLSRDLFPHQPTVVTIMLGMNDGYYMPFDPKYLDIFESGYRDLIKAISAQSPSPRITLISPTPYDEVTHGTEFAHYNEVVSRHAAFVKELAASSHLSFSDFNEAETNLLNVAQRSNPKLASLLVPDRIHPAEASHWVMAAELARSWGLSPVVSRVRIDAAQRSATEAQRAQVSGLDQKDGSLQWTQTDEALPLPLPLHDEMIQFVLALSDLASMDQQILRVDGLSAAQYTLKIDGHIIKSFTREQLAAGINLALFATPIQSQAKDVDGIELKRMRLDETNFIMSIEDPKVSGTADTSRAIGAKDAALLAEERKQAQPKPHHFELLPQ
jgi:lysophospholipase L1-like esterase